MLRSERFKYARFQQDPVEQLFDMQADPQELHNQAAGKPEVVRALRRDAVAACRTPGAAAALAGDDLRTLPLKKLPLWRVYQFDRSRGVIGFPSQPENLLTPSNKKGTGSEPRGLFRKE